MRSSASKKSEFKGSIFELILFTGKNSKKSLKAPPFTKRPSLLSAWKSLHPVKYDRFLTVGPAHWANSCRFAA
jgi:hypothetical protein